MSVLNDFIKDGDAATLRRKIRSMNSGESIAANDNEWPGFYEKSSELKAEFFRSHDSGDLLKCLKDAFNSSFRSANTGAFLEFYFAEDAETEFFAGKPYFTARQCCEASAHFFYYAEFGNLAAATGTHLLDQWSRDTDNNPPYYRRILSFDEISEFEDEVSWHVELVTTADSKDDALRLLDVLEKAIASFLSPLPYVSPSY